MIVSFTSSEELKNLSSSGKLLLGGEKRIVQYKLIEQKNCADKASESDIASKIEESRNNNNNSLTKFVSTVPVEATTEILEKQIVSSGKLFVTAGWDFAKRFHKDTKNWILLIPIILQR